MVAAARTLPPPLCPVAATERSPCAGTQGRSNHQARNLRTARRLGAGAPFSSKKGFVCSGTSTGSLQCGEQGFPRTAARRDANAAQFGNAPCRGTLEKASISKMGGLRRHHHGLNRDGLVGPPGPLLLALSTFGIEIDVSLSWCRPSRLPIFGGKKNGRLQYPKATQSKSQETTKIRHVSRVGVCPTFR